MLTQFIPAAQAADTSAALTARLEKDLVPPLVTAIGLLGRGEVERAVDQFETLIGRKFRTGNGPFAGNERASWIRTFAPLGKTKLSFENVELIGLQRVSSQAYRICLVGNGNQGPVLFQCRVYEYGGLLRLANVRFDMNWERIEFQIDRLDQRFGKKYAVKPSQTAGAPKTSAKK